jgi:nicotinate phosphoribosyltransferase
MTITSILDTDLYKLTIQQAVMKASFLGKNFRDFKVEYEFINRKSTKFSIGFVKTLVENINAMQNVSLAMSEMLFLRSLNLFDDEYLTYLKNYRFNPDQVNVTYSLEDGLKVTVKGNWLETILWEVPILAMISELYYEDTKPFIQDEKTIRRNAMFKAERLQNTSFVEFGTRRRFSKHLQNVVLESMLGTVRGTSNVALAMRHDIPVVGTQAHEWFMAIGAAFGYQFANQIALQAWQDVYKHKLSIALTDTFTSDVFFRDIDTTFAASYAGLRQDSGDPLEFAEKAAIFYQNQQNQTKSFLSGFDYQTHQHSIYQNDIYYSPMHKTNLNYK